MYKDREVIHNIINKMLDSPHKEGIYPVSTAYAELENYIESVRAEAIGRMHSDACTMLGSGDDTRVADAPDDFEIWWSANESGFSPYETEDMEEFAERVARHAWINSSYNRSLKEKSRLRALRNTWKET